MLGGGQRGCHSWDSALFSVLLFFCHLPKRKKKNSGAFFAVLLGLDVEWKRLGEHGQLISYVRLHVLWIAKSSNLLWTDASLDCHHRVSP